MNKKIIIGARGSKLSLSYAETVKKLFFSASNQKKELEIQTIKTSGDIFHDKRISDIGGKNIFCREIENQLIEKKIDNTGEILNNLRDQIIKSLNHTLTCNSLGHELAFEVAKKTVNKVSCNLNDYMFMYVTDDFKLAFKHHLNRDYVYIDYV